MYIIVDSKGNKVGDILPDFKTAMYQISVYEREDREYGEYEPNNYMAVERAS